MEIIICTPSNQNTTREREAAINELISDLYSLKIPIRTSYGEQAPDRRGVTWWEILYIYLVSRGVDAVTGYAYSAALDQVTDRTKGWIRKRFARAETRRPQYFAILDDEGKVLQSWKIDAEGEVEMTRDDDEEKHHPPSAEV
jgi:hypothetical protein